MDNLRQLGRRFKKSRKDTKRSLDRNKRIFPQIEHVRDTMDPMISFEIEFQVIQANHKVLLDLDFMPPPKTGCCADCSCSVCEFFDGGITETLILLTYAYVPGTVVVFKNNVRITQFVETSPELGQVTIFAHNNEDMIVCYVYDVCI